MSDATMTRSAQQRVRAIQTRIDLTERDLAMFRSLSDARFLPARAIEWLHWPSWWDRYARWVEQQHKPFYQPSSWMYDRLRRLEDTNLIMRVVRPVRLAINSFGRDTDLLALTKRGAETLAEMTQTPIEQIHYEATTERSLFTITHTADLALVYAALRSKIDATSGLSFDSWFGDHVTKRHFDKVGPKQEGLQPDGAFYLRHAKGRALCFVELDRHRAVNTWADKIRKYEQYVGSVALQERYGEQTYMLLAVTDTEKQRRAMIAATNAVLQQLGRPASPRFLFALQQDVHPTTIGSCWLNLREQPHVLVH